MDKVVLGRSGLEVGVAALGGGGKSRLGQKQGHSRAHSVALVQAAIDAGVTLIDTAAVYGTEGIIGEAIRGRRDGLVISTKTSINLHAHDDATEMVDGAGLVARVEERLTALGIDCIDILHLHALRLEQVDYTMAELAPALIRLREAGKVRFFGLTERFVHDATHRMLLRAAQEDFWDVFMPGFNMVNQTALAELLPATTARGIGTLCMFAVRGPLGSLEGANALISRLVESGEVDPDGLDPANPLGFLLAPGVADSMAEAAYRFCRHTPGIDVVITGTGSPAHLAENLRTLNLPPLPEAVRARLAAIFGRVTSETCEPR